MHGSHNCIIESLKCNRLQCHLCFLTLNPHRSGWEPNERSQPNHKRIGMTQQNIWECKHMSILANIHK